VTVTSHEGEPSAREQTALIQALASVHVWIGADSRST